MRNTPTRRDEPSKSEWEVVNRVVYPIRDQDLVMPLYAIEWTRPHLTAEAVEPRVRFRAVDFARMNRTEIQRLIDESVRPHADRSIEDVFTVDGRTAITVHKGRHASMCTYFNAFPAAYWRRWTNVDTVRFDATVRGAGHITVFRSNGRGLFAPVGTIEVNAAKTTQRVCLDVPMAGLMDGGFIWFDAKADRTSPLKVSDATWSVRAERRVMPEHTTLSIAITTFNRAPYCLDQLKAIASDSPVRERLDTIYCVDQGTDLVRDRPGFNAVATALGPQLTYLRQANLGGSGGFSRGMFETLKAGTSSYTLLLDDDAISEPEAILRAAQFADYCTKPTIVGGGMFHLDNRTVLYTQGERYERGNVWTAPSGDLEYNHDFAVFPLRDSPERHRRIDADYNGWWMCLIPTAVMRDIGLSLPVFIKFDDTEYGVRAGEHGYHTVCLPGVALWHQAWHDKDPSRTWEEYFFQRNRWICGLLHNPRPSWRFAYQMLYGDMNVGAKLVYSALRLRHMGLRDIMRGPEYIFDSMPNKLDEVRKAREGFADSTLLHDRDDVPEPEREYVPKDRPETRAEIGKDGILSLARALLSRGDGTAAERPDLSIAAQDAIWRAYKHTNAPVVTTPDGNAISWCRRDSKLFRSQIRRGLFLSKELLKRWEDLSARYRAADLASITRWERIFSDPAVRIDE